MFTLKFISALSQPKNLFLDVNLKNYSQLTLHVPVREPRKILIPLENLIKTKDSKKTFKLKNI